MCSAEKGSPRHFAWHAGLLLASLAIAACGRPEDPARVELRARLKQQAGLSKEELGRLREEVSRSIAGRAFRVSQDGASQVLDEPRRTVVFGMLSDRAGMFDEGLRTRGASTFRVLNAPGESRDAEVEATERLWIDVETFLPARYEFAYAVPGAEDYAFDLTVIP
jgi:hypothetical protein